MKRKQAHRGNHQRSLVDPMHYFRGDAPFWKLAALLICRLGPTLVGITVLFSGLNSAGLLG